MTIPPGKTAAEVEAAIEKVVNQLTPGFVFGPYDLDDIKQEGRIYALVELESGKYDPARPLENYLYSVVKSRLINLKRGRLRRTDAPCRKCHAGEPCSPDGPCATYAAWRDRNQAKANLCCPTRLTDAARDGMLGSPVGRTAHDVEVDEVVAIVRARLPADMQGDFLKLREGAALPKDRRLEVEAAVREIVGGVVDAA